MTTTSHTVPETAQLRPRNSQPGTSDLPGPNFFRVLNAETIKFRTVPSTVILTVVVLVIMVGFAALSGWGVSSLLESNSAEASQLPGGDALADFIYALAASGSPFGAIFVAALAVVFISSEYSTGMIRSTVLAEPRRWKFLTAKAVIIGVASFVLGVLSMALGILVVSLFFTGESGFEINMFSERGLTVILMQSLYFALVAIMSLAIGSLVKNTAGGIVVTTAILFVLPLASSILSGVLEWVRTASEYLPMNLGTVMTSADPMMESGMSPWGAAGYLAIWAFVPLLAALTVQRFRDIN